MKENRQSSSAVDILDEISVTGLMMLDFVLDVRELSESIIQAECFVRRPYRLVGAWKLSYSKTGSYHISNEVKNYQPLAIVFLSEWFWPPNLESN